jgi:hypothetical protein
MVQHSDAIAEDRAASERAGRVNGYHGHRSAISPKKRKKPVDQRTLAYTRSARDSERESTAGVREQLAEQIHGTGCTVLDGCCCPRDRTRVTREDFSYLDAISSCSGVAAYERAT